MSDERPRLLDLFSGAGGCARGYQEAGFHVTGVDLHPQPRYCGDAFYQADALTFPLEGYDVIHASPPCQAYSAGGRMRGGYTKVHPRLIEPMRRRLKGYVYVIENVPGAPLYKSIMLCGSMFGLRVRRHRIFESSVFLLGQSCRHAMHPVVVGVYGDHPQDSVIRKGHPARRACSIDGAQHALGITWMTTWHELKESIPPAYTRYLGQQLMHIVRGDAP